MLNPLMLNWNLVISVHCYNKLNNTTLFMYACVQHINTMFFHLYLHTSQQELFTLACKESTNVGSK